MNVDNPSKRASFHRSRQQMKKVMISYLFIYLFTNTCILFCLSIKFYFGYACLNYAQVYVGYLFIYNFVRNCFI